MSLFLGSRAWLERRCSQLWWLRSIPLTPGRHFLPAFQWSNGGKWYIFTSCCCFSHPTIIYRQKDLFFCQVSWDWLLALLSAHFHLSSETSPEMYLWCFRFLCLTSLDFSHGFERVCVGMYVQWYAWMCIFVSFHMRMYKISWFWRRSIFW